MNIIHNYFQNLKKDRSSQKRSFGLNETNYEKCNAYLFCKNSTM